MNKNLCDHLKSKIATECKFIKDATEKASVYAELISNAEAEEEYMYYLDRLEAHLRDLKVCHDNVARYETLLQGA